MRPYIPRLVDPLVERLLEEVPAIWLTGPRGAGKTTTAIRYARTVVRLDAEREAAAFRADPDAALRGLREPVVIDEWQIVPTVMGAIKRAVDGDPRPGRFVITGSVRADLDDASWPGTGRLVRVPMYGLTMRESDGDPTGPTFIDRVLEGRTPRPPTNTPDLRGYIEIALASGYPEARRLDPAVRNRWLESYVEQSLTRDPALIDERRDPVRLRRYFEAICLNTAGVVEDKTLYDAAGVNKKTAKAYDELLERLLVSERTPAWSSNRLKRLVRSSKRYIVDVGLMVGSIGVDESMLLREGDLMGRVLDTFVASQLRAEAPVSDRRPRIYHLRQEEGRREIDILLELAGEQVIGIEVKADAAPESRDARHLQWLKESLGSRFAAGLVFHTGPRTYQLASDIFAAPIATLWA